MSRSKFLRRYFSSSIKTKQWNLFSKVETGPKLVEFPRFNFQNNNSKDYYDYYKPLITSFSNNNEYYGLIIADMDKNSKFTDKVTGLDVWRSYLHYFRVKVSENNC